MNSNTGKGPSNVNFNITDANKAAKTLRKCGFAICRIDKKEKKPTYPGWSTKSLEACDIATDDLIGILGGPLSDGNEPETGLLGLDLDDEAAVKKADKYLPPTQMIEGRKSKPRSHRYYLVPLASIPEGEHSPAKQAAPAAIAAKGHPGPRTRAFRDADGREILRLIGTGAQAVCPPSLHPSGEQRLWDSPDGKPGKPATVEYKVLRAAIDKLASACGWEPKVATAIATGHSSGIMKPTSLSAALDHRISYYLDACPPAISGQGGHNQLFSVAVAITHGFALNAADALKMLSKHYNPQCRPLWSIEELRHKVEGALSAAHDKPRGYLLTRKLDAPEPLPEDTPPLIRKAFDARVQKIAGWKIKANKRG